MDATGNLVILVDQDRSLWDGARIAEGRRQLELSATGAELTSYHVEAAIAALHADADDPAGTDWDGIVGLYETLLKIQPSPVVALNRAVAVAQRDGPTRGIEEITRIADRKRLERYPFYFTALGEFELRLRHPEAARKQFETALKLARSPAERRFLQRRIRSCEVVEA